jgi:hypothetical protein
MLTIQHPKTCLSERGWILDVLFREFLGIDYVAESTHGTDFLISMGGRTLSFPDTFFSLAHGDWLSADTLPERPLSSWDTTKLGLPVNVMESTIPIIYGASGSVVEAESIRLNLDILGSSFFMLSRYEEAVNSERDEHDRFPGVASLAAQEGFLLRPIVNEYLEILWSCIHHLWPTLSRKRRQFRTLVSVDVDVPYSNKGRMSFPRYLKKVAGDILKRGSPSTALKRSMGYILSFFNNDNYGYDPLYSNFDWMMKVNEEAGNVVAFYFITDQSDSEWNGCYSMDEPCLRELIRNINCRGHEIGLHPSYNTYKDRERTRREADILRKVMAEEGCEQTEIGGRQHFLRWDAFNTARNWNDSGLAYDTSLAYADRAGFRCGTCFEYPVYDLRERCALSLRERPLIVMECTVILDEYEGRGRSEEALAMMLELKKTCRKFSGDFTLLWHNSSIECRWDKESYRTLVRGDSG